MVTSLPDATELSGLPRSDWSEWFTSAAALVIARTPPEGVSIFYQSDVKRQGAWIDKASLCLEAARREGAALLWHKIVCRVPAGTVTRGRAGYGHLLCFARELRQDLSRATADVLPDGGPVAWVRGIGLNACTVACRYILEETATRTVVDPFCGVGSVLAVANSIGLNAVGVELNRKRAAQARALEISEDEFHLRRETLRSPAD